MTQIAKYFWIDKAKMRIVAKTQFGKTVFVRNVIFNTGCPNKMYALFKWP